MDGLVSVIIPTFNRARLVARAIRSALEQSYAPVEILVVDDGSTDATGAVLEGFGEALRTIRQPNRGRSAARNRGLEEARGEYIAFLDSDDIWLPQTLEAEVAALRRQPEARVSYSWWDLVDEGNQPLRRHRARFEGDVFEPMYWRNFVSTCNILVRRECFNAPAEPPLRFDSNVCSNEDWLLWLRLAARYRFCCAPRVGAAIACHSGNTFSSESLERLTADLGRFEAGLAGDPVCAERLERLGRRARAVWPHRLGHLRLLHGHRRTAWAAFFQAWRICPAYWPVYSGLAQSIVGRGRVQRWLRFWTWLAGERTKGGSSVRGEGPKCTV